MASSIETDRSRQPSSSRDIAHFLFARKFALFGTWIGVTALTAVLVYLMPQSYTSQVQVYVESNVDPTLRTTQNPYPIDSVEVIESEIAILTSRTVAERVVDRLHLDQPNANPGTMKKVVDSLRSTLSSIGLVSNMGQRDKAIRRLQKRINAEQVPLTSHFAMRYASGSPEEAQRVAQTITDIYIDRHYEIFKRDTADFFEKLIADIRMQLEVLRQQRSRAVDQDAISQLTLEIDTLESSYKFYRDKLDEAKAETAAGTSMVNVHAIDTASLPPKPSMSRLTTIIIASIAGLIMGFSLSLLLNHFDHRIYRPDDFAKHTRLRLIGTLRYGAADFS